MSTKIYNGIRFTTNDITEIYNELMKLRDEAIQIGQKLQAETITESLVSIVDKYMAWTHFGIPNDSEFLIPEGKEVIVHGKNEIPLLGHCSWEFLDKARDKKDKNLRADSDYVFNLKVMIHPIPGKLLGTEYGSSRAFTDLLFKCPLVKDYHYQNQTDQPDDISDEDWDQRRDDWDLALPGIGIPLYNGLEITIFDNGLLDIHPPHQFLVDSIPNFEKRVELVAKDWIFRKYYKQFKDELPPKEENENESSFQKLRKDEDNAMAVYWKTRDHLKTDEVQQEIKDCENDLRVVLLSTQDLTRLYFDPYKPKKNEND